MTLKEIAERESHNESCIYLYREGIFWKAYQKSAFLLLKHCKVNYAVKHRFVKSADCEIFSLGFPQNALERLFSKVPSLRGSAPSLRYLALSGSAQLVVPLFYSPLSLAAR